VIAPCWIVSASLVLGLAAPPDPVMRSHDGPTEATWTGPEVEAVASGAQEDPGKSSRSPAETTAAPPRPVVDPQALPILIAIALAPEAPGSTEERALLDALERTAVASTDPPTKVRRLRPGAPPARQICRQGRYDLVVTIGYVPERDAPVLSSHDCRLDVPLGVRASDAVHEPLLVRALWDEHEALVRAGVQERRMGARLRPGVRAGIVAGVALVVLGVAVGVLVANGLREERVVLEVTP